jgi:hypothetical protein
MDYTAKDLPVSIHHGEVVDLGNGTMVRFDPNGDAKDVFIDGSFDPAIQLFPDCDFVFESGGSTYKVTATFADDLIVEKL